MVKAQVYSEYAGVGKSVGKDIRQAFQRLINFYPEPGSDRHGAEASALRETADMERYGGYITISYGFLWRSGNRENTGEGAGTSSWRLWAGKTIRICSGL